eukprot:scaffold57590_cov34-Prasinocladus_malaysianus.AAC.3
MGAKCIACNWVLGFAATAAVLCHRSAYPSRPLYVPIDVPTSKAAIPTKKCVLDAIIPLVRSLHHWDVMFNGGQIDAPCCYNTRHHLHAHK